MSHTKAPSPAAPMSKKGPNKPDLKTPTDGGASQGESGSPGADKETKKADKNLTLTGKPAVAQAKKKVVPYVYEGKYWVLRVDLQTVIESDNFVWSKGEIGSATWIGIPTEHVPTLFEALKKRIVGSSKYSKIWKLDKEKRSLNGIPVEKWFAEVGVTSELQEVLDNQLSSVVAKVEEKKEVKNPTSMEKSEAKSERSRSDVSEDASLLDESKGNHEISFPDVGYDRGSLKLLFERAVGRNFRVSMSKLDQKNEALLAALKKSMPHASRKDIANAFYHAAKGQTIDFGSGIKLQFLDFDGIVCCDTIMENAMKLKGKPGETTYSPKQEVRFVGDWHPVPAVKTS